MASLSPLPRSLAVGTNSWRQTATPEDFVVESWSEGFMVGALIIMACITVANMRKGVLLHKLILAEQLFAMLHGTFCFMAWHGYGYYLSGTATFLYLSWIIHNTVAWLKIRPFFVEPRSMFKPELGRWVTRIYIGTLCCTVPAIILQIVDNFLFFNNLGDNRYKHVRPYEPLMRDPWWVFTCVTLFHIIRKCYGTGTFELIKRSPRFGILLGSIILAMTFTICDIAASIKNFTGSTDGINPWWKLSLVFKCLTDTIMLDDFKTELKKLGIKRIQKDEQRRQSHALVLDDHDDHDLESKGDQDELEFTDVLGAGPRPDELNRNGTLRRPAQKNGVGKMGMKISNLPSLGKFQFRSSGKKERAGDEDEDEKVEGFPLPGEPLSPTDTRGRVAQTRRSLGVVDWETG